jgi:hypothetical protein
MDWIPILFIGIFVAAELVSEFEYHMWKRREHANVWGDEEQKIA